MTLTADDWQAIGLSLRLATITTVLLLLISSPLAYWLALSKHRLRSLVNAMVALPLVLPPTVVGFYLLVVFSPVNGLGKLLLELGLPRLVFSFEGLVIASVIYSLPFVVQPIQTAIVAIPRQTLETATVMGAGVIDRFFTVVLPQAKIGFISAAVLGFTHTVGEFGIVLMMGGNIAGETRVVSLQLYDHVEALDYAKAHSLAALLVVFSFVALVALYVSQYRASDTTGRR